MNTFKKNFLAFIRFNQIFVSFLIAAFIVQILVGVVLWKVLIICAFLGVIAYFKYIKNLNFVGNFLIILVVGLWAYHLIKVEFNGQGPVTEKMSIYAQNEKDVRLAEEISPKYVATRQVLILEKQEMQNEYAIKIRQALDSKDYKLVEKLNEEQIAETKRIDDQIRKIDDASKVNQELKADSIKSQPQQLLQWSVEKIGKNKVRVHFVPNCTINTGLKIKPGDTYKFSRVTAPFDVAGSSKPFYTINSDINFQAKESGYIYLYGAGYKGCVDIEVKP